MSIRYLSGLSVDSTVLVVDAANDRVGIGTASPARTFEVNGYISAFDGTTRTEIINGGGVGFFGTQTNHPLAFQTNNAERMRITSAGNVGIGTTGPVGRLDVSASVAASGGVVGLVNLTNTNTGGNVVNAILPASTVADAVFYRAQTVSAGANDQYFFAGQTGNNTSITTNKVLITTNGAATFSSSVTASSLIKTGGTSAQYLMADGSVSTLTNPVTGTGTTNYVPKFTSASAIGNSALQEVSGNLGLGVTPSAWGNATKAIQIGGYSSFVNDGNGANNVTSNAYESATGTWNYIISLGATRYRQSFGDHTWFIAPSGTAGNAITFTQAMTLDASGNLGIGTTSPSQKLEVSGALVVGMTTPAPFWNALFKDYSDGSGVYISSVNSGGGKYITGNAYYYNSALWRSDKTVASAINLDNGTVVFYTNSGLTANTDFTPTERMRITSAGNVGIGTTSPANTLQIGSVGATGYGGNRLAVGDGTNVVVLHPGAVSYLTANGDIVVGAGGNTTNQVYVKSGGNVGIGTASPGVSLDVSGSGIRITNATPNVYFNNTVVQWKAYLPTSTNNFAINDAVRDVLTLGYNGAASFFQGCNVGIGTTSPLSILNVQKATNTELSLTYTTNSGANYTQISGGSINLVNKWATIQFKQDASEDAHHIIFSTANPSTNTTERMRITSAGNVGIGTTSPGGYKLNVSGTGYYSGQLTVDGFTNNSGISFRDGFDPANVGVRAKAVGTANRDGLELLGYNGIDFTVNNGANVAMRIVGVTGSGMGNVGIGTTSPSQKLDVSGNIMVLGLKNTDNYFEKILGDVSFTNGDANKAFNIILGNTSVWGYIEVEVNSTFNNQSSAGKLTKRFAIGTNPNNLIYINESRVADAMGTIVNNIAIGEFAWDGAISSYVIPISHIVSTGNAYNVRVRCYSADGGASTVFAALSLSAVYTLTALARQYPYYNDRLGIGTTAPKTKLDVNGTIGFGSKSMSMTDTFAAALTLNMNDHTGCYVKLTAFGDWGNHSTIAYLGEFFIQASAGGYNEPGIIIRQVDNTATDDIQAQILDPAGAGTRDFIIELKATSATATPFTAHLQYEVRGQYNSVS